MTDEESIAALEEQNEALQAEFDDLQDELLDANSRIKELEEVVGNYRESLDAIRDGAAEALRIGRE